MLSRGKMMPLDGIRIMESQEKIEYSGILVSSHTPVLAARGVLTFHSARWSPMHIGPGTLHRRRWGLVSGTGWQTELFLYGWWGISHHPLIQLNTSSCLSFSNWFRQISSSWIRAMLKGFLWRVVLERHWEGLDSLRRWHRLLPSRHLRSTI